ncbi:hypothetical protein GQ457_04G025000 [Hibiscus cannabinus]
MRDRILLNHNRVSRGLSHDQSCHLCANADETSIHILRDCSVIRTLWLHFLDFFLCSDFFELPLTDWLRANLSSSSRVAGIDCEWNVLFTSLFWKTWKSCNAKLFQGISLAFDTLLHVGTLWAKRFSAAAETSLATRVFNVEHARWIPPAPGIFCLNIDGVVSKSGLGSAGGHIHDAAGTFIVGFTKNIGHTTPLLVELWCFFEGLKLAWLYGFEIVKVQTDCSEVQKLISSPVTTSPYSLIRSIAHLINRAWSIDIQVIKREANSVVDLMAKRPLGSGKPWLVMDSHPASLVPILDRDIHGPLMLARFAAIMDNLLTSTSKSVAFSPYDI